MGRRNDGTGVGNKSDSNIPFYKSGNSNKRVQLNVQERAALGINEIEVDVTSKYLEDLELNSE